MSPTAQTATGASAFLAEVRIQDFRAISDLCMPLRTNTVLLGENNAGKTCFLEALDIAIGDRRASYSDLRVTSNRGTATAFHIDVRVIPANGDEFVEAIAHAIGEAVQLGNGANEPDFYVIRTRGELDANGIDIVLRRSFLRGWARDRTGAAHLTELSTPLVTRKALELTRFHLLNARRDIVDQVRNRRTFWGKLLGNLHLSPSFKDEVEATLAGLRTRIVSGSSPLQNLERDLQEIGPLLSQPSASVKIEPIPGEIKDLLEAMDVVVSDSSHGKVSVGRQGMGTRSLAALLIFRSYVRAMLAADSSVAQSIAAFEEPEAHLHPHGQRSVLSVLRQLPGQRIVSTHSSHIAGAADVFDLRLFRRSLTGTEVAWVPEKSANGTPCFTNDELVAIRRFVQRRNGEILFARVVILYEGETEDSALPVLASAFWGVSPDAKGVSLVNVDGAGNYKHLLKLLAIVQIPWLIFSDGDAAGKKGVEAVGAAINRTVDSTSPEVVMLPNGNDFESYMLAEGYRSHAERAISRCFGTDALAQYRQRTDGTSLGNNRGQRDYQSVGWEDRLVGDFLRSHKGTYGAYLGEEIATDVGPNGTPRLPAQVRNLFERADNILRRLV